MDPSYQSDKNGSKLDANMSPSDSKTSIITTMPPYLDPTLSYAYGKSTKELRYSTLGSVMESTCRSQPESLSVVVDDEGILKNFGELNNDINMLVNGMVNKFNLRRGDNIGLYSYSCYRNILVHYASYKLGLVVNPFNPSFKAQEFSSVMKMTNIKVLFMPGRNSRQSHLNDHWSVICDSDLAKLQSDSELGSFRDIVLIDGELEESDMALKDIKVSRWRSIVSNNHQLEPEAEKRIKEVSSDDLYCVYYTSGTTGQAKGAAISQFTALNNAIFSLSRLFVERGPKFENIKPNICLPLPIFHAFAGVLGLLMPFTNSGSIVIPGLRYSVESVVQCIQKYDCNSIMLTPTILIDMLGYIEDKNITELPLKSIVLGGAPVMLELIHKTRRVLTGLEEIRIGYGSSENGVIASIQTSQEPEETRPLTVGPPLDLTEIRIVDLNTGLATPRGQTGEVQTRGFNTMAGYINDPKRTKEVINDARWYRTGDLGIINKHGSLQIVGRIKDLIIKGGENIYPAEIETVLHGHPDIEDAHAFGIPDKRLGEEVCVWIKLKGASRNKNEDVLRADILEFCKSKLTYFKVPKHVMFVTEFPTTPVKKIKKFEMRAKTIKFLGLTEFV